MISTCHFVESWAAALERTEPGGDQDEGAIPRIANQRLCAEKVTNMSPKTVPNSEKIAPRPPPVANPKNTSKKLKNTMFLPLVSRRFLAGGEMNESIPYCFFG